MRVPLGCLIALLVVTSTNAEGRQWIFDDNPEAPTLSYGAPDSDDILISFSCEPAVQSMTVVEAVGAAKLEPGRPTTFRLSAGAATLELTGDAIANEIDGAVNIEVVGPPSPRLFALLKAGPSLAIEVIGEKETIPLKDAAAHVGVLEKLCFGRR
jgi:hypothetical protein